MTWETKDVVVIVGLIAALATTFGVLKAQLAAHIRETENFKRDTLASLKDQGRRLGELEVASKIAREIARFVGKGTPAFGTVFPPPDRRRSEDSAGQVGGEVDDEQSERR